MEPKTTRADIEEFLAVKRVAFVGVSRDEKSFGNMVFREFRGRGYNVLPVNPNAPTLEGERCYARVQDIQPAPEAALILTSREASEQAVRDCAEAGVKRVWLYGVSGPSAVNERAIALALEHGMKVIPGYCPYMFLPKSGLGHRMHGFVARLTGAAPA